MKKLSLIFGWFGLLLFIFVDSASAQSVIQTTDVTVVYSNSQTNSTFENVNKFYFSNGNLIIDQNGVETSIPTNTVRRLELAAISTFNDISEWDEDAIFVYPNPTSDKLFFDERTAVAVGADEHFRESECEFVGKGNVYHPHQ